ncbi:MAG: ADP-ribosylglycohydrolase family protein [Acidobacteriota bacterium]|nr:MAG: ADP-ribosylglycohydrolase family protein [Acidobacteriota bacterium]
MKPAHLFKALLPLLAVLCCCSSSDQLRTRDVSAAELRDKINGGLLGQFFGNLNGLPHENKYFEEPGSVSAYVPDLSDGAFTDDDTDIEFVYIWYMNQEDEIQLPYDRVYELWIDHIKEHIWCSNEYARRLMEIGFKPPNTGRIAFNPWAVFNISGQFLSEQFGLIAPGMPQTAARIGTHYTHVAVDGEPIQATQMFDAMIATAFFEDDFMQIVSAELASLDPGSELHEIVSRVIDWYNSHPDDWRATRRKIKEAYWSGEWAGPGGSNGYRTITAATIGSILHGEGDFVKSIQLAFNFGWDADNISAMVGTIMGLLKGEKWIREQGWSIKDEYRNSRRPALPTDLTITEFAELHFRLARRVILENGGTEIQVSGEEGFRIALEPPANIEEIPRPLNRLEEMRAEWHPIIQRDLAKDSNAQARAVYAAVCLGLAGEIAFRYPEEWREAITAFQPHFENLFEHDMWSREARDYFREVVVNGDPGTEYPPIWPHPDW